MGGWTQEPEALPSEAPAAGRSREGGTFAPSMLTLAVVVYSFLWVTVLGSWGDWPGPPETRLTTREDAHPKRLGVDFEAPFRAGKDFMRHQRVYWPAVKRHPVYDYIPQSLVMAWPFAALFRFRTGYYFFVQATALATFVLLMAAALRSWRPGAWRYAVMFPLLMLLSEGGSLLYRRGNFEALAATSGAAAYLCVLTGRHKTAAVFFALMTCVKPLYAPFGAFMLLFRERWRMVGVYVAVHVLACATLVLYYGSTSIVLDYFRYLPGYVAYMQDWVGGYNVSLLSMLSMQFPSRRAELMGLLPSLLILGLGTLVGLAVPLWGRGRTFLEKEGRPVAFLYFAHVCLSWQSITMMYASLILLPAIPWLDRLYGAWDSRPMRLGLLAYALLLGVLFTPYLPAKPFDEKGPFYFLAFLAAGWILVGSRAHLESRRAPSAPEP